MVRCALFVLYFSVAFATPFQCPTCVSLAVGPAIYVGGPTCCNYDNPVTGINSSGVIRAYSANAKSYLVIEGSSMDANLATPPEIGLNPGTSSSDLDYCGAWLNAAMVDTSTSGLIRGWYHEEFMCNYEDNFFTNKSIAYAESTDGGKTFTKTTDYPNNAVILPPAGNTTTAHQCGEGDHGVTKVGSYYYLYFLEWDGWNGGTTIGLARATVASGGKPGAWYKYYNGDFTQPGRGGQSSMIRGVPGTAVYYRTSSDYVAIGIQGASDSSGEPFLGFSDDGFAWKQLSDPVLHVIQSSWNRTGNPGELVAYVGLQGPQGALEMGNDLTFFYTYLQPGEDFNKRYLAKRTVKMVLNSAPVTGPKVHVALTLYQSPGDSWATTAMIPPAQGYKTIQLLGGVFTTSAYAGTVAIYDCYISEWDDHMVGTPGECGPTDWGLKPQTSEDERHVIGPQRHASMRGKSLNTEKPALVEFKTPAFPMGVSPLRILGWIWSQPTGLAKALYRCWNADTTDHSVSMVADCSDRGSGYKMEFILGYIDPQPA